MSSSVLMKMKKWELSSYCLILEMLPLDPEKNVGDSLLPDLLRCMPRNLTLMKKKMMEKLWGDNYFDAAKKVWKKEGLDEN